MRSRFAPLAALLSLLLVARAAVAAPADTRVGDVRATYSKNGTVARASGEATAAALATWPANTRVTVEEVKLPWIRVRANGVVGWLRAWETVEVGAVQPSPVPAHLTDGGGGTANARDVSAAGRQFDADTERNYRLSRRELLRAYALVDEMERTTQSMDPIDAVSFILEGNLLRRGHDCERPARLPPEPPPQEDAAGSDEGPGGGGFPNLPFGKLPKIPSGLKKVLKIGARMRRLQAQLENSFSASQEYYLGRAVAANAIAKYGLDPDPVRRAYVRLIGDAIVRASNRVPANYGGYHFDVLDSDEVNAVSGPGGFVLVTRGTVLAAKDEDRLAGVIAHELAHVTRKHGEQTLRRGKNFQAAMKGVTGLIAEGLDDKGVAPKLLELFGQSVGDMARTGVEHSYGRELEFDADQEGTAILFDVLYDHAALRDFLRLRASDSHPAGADTHAPPAVRAQALDPVIARWPAFPDADLKKPRVERFAAASKK